MKNAVMLLMYNTTSEQFELSKETFDSILTQDIGPLSIWLIDNGSLPETKEWTKTLTVAAPHELMVSNYPENASPIGIVNRAMATLFSAGYDKILGCPNDAILPPNLYSELAKWPRGMVAAWMNGNRDFKRFEKSSAVHEDIHMSVMMTRKWAYDALVEKDGYFLDPGYFLYASDCDLKLRMAACGIHGVQLDIQTYHYGSACWRLAKPEIGRAINVQADKDREYFARKWGFGIGSPEHVAALVDLNFRGESKIWS